jgi:hypothetical protein
MSQSIIATIFWKCHFYGNPFPGVCEDDRALGGWICLSIAAHLERRRIAKMFLLLQSLKKMRR